MLVTSAMADKINHEMLLRGLRSLLPYSGLAIRFLF